MEKSNILDQLIDEELEVEVRAVDENGQDRPRIKGTLFDYDSQGFLFREKGEKGENSEDSYSFTYLPRSSVNLRFSSSDFGNRELENQGECYPLRGKARKIYRVGNITYDPLNRQLRKGNKTTRINGEKLNICITQFFDAGIGRIISQNSLEGLSEDAHLPKKKRANLKVRISNVRKYLRRFGLDIEAVAGQGYTLKN